MREQLNISRSIEELRCEFLKFTEEYFCIQSKSNAKELNKFTLKLNKIVEVWSKNYSVDLILRPLMKDQSSEIRFMSASYLIRYNKDIDVINTLVALKNDNNPHISVFSPIVIDVNLNKNL